MSLEETAAALLRRRANITEKGKRHRATMQEVVLLGQIKKAVEGDHKAAKLILEFGQKAPSPQESLTPEEHEEALRGCLRTVPA